MKGDRWKTLNLDEAFWFQEGPGVRTSQFSDSGIKLLNVANITNRGIDLSKTSRYLSEEEVNKKYQHFLVDAGDLVIASSGISFDADGLLRTRGAFVREKHLPLCMNTSTIRFKAKENVSDLAFLKFWLNSNEFRSQVTRFVTGSAQQNFGPSHLRAIQITLPTLSEQKRIAAVLDKADAIRERRRLAIANLDLLTKSIFLDMFGDPATNPKEWPQKRISEIGKVITGNTPPRSNAENYGSAIEWIKSDNINTPHYYVTPADEGLSQTGKSIARIAPPGSILVTCIAGTPDCIGNAAMTDREVAFNQQINAFIPDSGDPHFYYAQILIGKRLIQRASTASMKGMVSKGRFEQIRLVVPPLELQNEFGQRLLALEKVKGMNRTSLAKMDECFASLQYRAFSGTL